MKCPECIKENKKSRVYVGHTTITAMAIQHYYDEDGKEVFYNPNTATTSYKCSNGHSWTEKS